MQSRIVLKIARLGLAVGLLGWFFAPSVHANRSAVLMVTLAYQPATVTVNVGDTVMWTNQDDAPHTATSETNIWTSPILNKGESYGYTFTKPGTYPYYCIIHGNMHGTIIVTGIAATATPTVPDATSTPVSGTVSPTSTPTATPAATPSATPFPGATILLDRSRAALTMASAYRIDEQRRMVATGSSTRRLHLTGDVVPKSHAERLHLITTVGQKKPVDIFLIQLGQRTWIKDAATHFRWAPELLKSVRRIDGILPNPLGGSQLPQATSLETMGPETFQGTYVWHVHGAITSSNHAVNGTLDVLVDQTRYLPLSISVTTVNRSSIASTTDRTVRSGFGEKVHIAAPLVGKD